MVANYATNQMTGETAIPSEYDRAITSRRLANVFDRLGLTRKREDRARFFPAQARLPPIPLNQPHLFNPPLLGSQHGQPQPEVAAELTHRYMYLLPRNRRER
ncbi:Hypothetical predicted protein [Olea europaea subsp. europaea]|uniref:Uncharacterized protein n=1 Tax=Olea europaea subsp. europaea TaxID=158383 RepID=A0A8S0T380_OLEEU|nr:Hypothetical predicted protein [Olea europaea subsp. europaea]